MFDMVAFVIWCVFILFIIWFFNNNYTMTIPFRESKIVFEVSLF